MTIKHHPSSASLMSCSAGAMPEAFAAVMASHIEMCPCCRKDLSALEYVGIALFEKLDPVAVSKPAPVMALRAAEAGDVDVLDRPVATDLPGPLAAVLGRTSLDQIDWKRVGPGVWQHQLPVRNAQNGEVRLIKVAPGQKLPEHGHSGAEMTLVLRGSYSDASGTYRAGDVAEMDDMHQHEPVADAVEGCVCLIAVEGKLRFKSRIARMVQPFTGF
jgi:putative transcriptional regulator